VPGDLAVLGVGNDFTVCESASVPLSSVDLDLKALVHRAASFLDLMMDGVGVRPQLLRTWPAGVVARVSTDVIIVKNPCVASALRYIAENYPNPMLYVTDVADAVGVSRRHLEKIMQEETGSTIGERITRARMQEASILLKVHPQAKKSDIARLVGLRSANNFHRRFRQFFGTSPEAHRSGNHRDASRETARPVSPRTTNPRLLRIDDPTSKGVRSVA
jgi:LacI family transcriptional regulator